MKFLLAIDFDATITIYDDIPKKWGDRLARRIQYLKNTFPMLEICILSAANKTHILYTTYMSGSKALLDMIMGIDMSTNESASIAHINHKWKESSILRKKMIETVTRIPFVRDNIEFIIAYKKTNYLIHRSKKLKIPHDHVFLLDDNLNNIYFASHYGFNALSTNNHDKEHNLFARLNEVEKFIMSKLSKGMALDKKIKT